VMGTPVYRKEIARETKFLSLKDVKELNRIIDLIYNETGFKLLLPITQWRNSCQG